MQVLYYCADVAGPFVIGRQGKVYDKPQSLWLGWTQLLYYQADIDTQVALQWGWLTEFMVRVGYSCFTAKLILLALQWG
jgi:hypothetical protein